MSAAQSFRISSVYGVTALCFDRVLLRRGAYIRRPSKTRLKMRFRFVFSVAALAVVSGTAEAQKIDDLVEGVRVRVEVPRVRAVEGTFQGASVDSVKVVSDGVHLVFPRAENVTVFRSAGVNRYRSALLVGTISGVLGAVAGGVIGSMSYKPCESKGVYDCGYVPNTRSRATVFGASVFGFSSMVIGGLVGAIHPGDVWVPVDR